MCQAMSDSPATGEFYALSDQTGGNDAFHRCFIADRVIFDKELLFIQTNAQLGDVTWTLRFQQNDQPHVITVGTLDTGVFQLLNMAFVLPFAAGSLDYFNWRVDLFDANGFVIRGMALKYQALA